MKKYTWLVSGAASAGLFAVTLGLLRWNPVVCLVLSAVLFGLMVLLLWPRGQEKRRHLPASLRELDQQAEAFQQAVLCCRVESLRSVGFDLYATVESLLDYLSAAPKSARRVPTSLAESLESCRALVEEYLLQEEKGTLRPESLAETRSALQQLDARFSELLIRLLRQDMPGTGSHPLLHNEMQTES